MLPAIPPGLEVKEFSTALKQVMEEASDRLLVEAIDRDGLPISPIAAAKYKKLTGITPANKSSG